MNRFLFLACFLLTARLACAQTLYGVLPAKDNRVYYLTIEQAPGLSKEQIYRRARRWFVENFRTANYVLQLQDRESGELVGKGVFVINFDSPYGGNLAINLRRTIAVDCKEGKFRVQLFDFTIADVPLESDKALKSYSKGASEGVVKAIDADSRQVMESIKKAVLSAVSEDW